MDFEVVQTLTAIKDSIDALAQPRLIDWLAVGISLMSAAISCIAIWFAVRVPKEIADKQDKIALFEKRYTIYRTLLNCQVFFQSFEKKDDVDDADNMKAVYMSFLATFDGENMLNILYCEQQKVHDIDIMAKIKCNQIVAKLRETKFLFSEEPQIFEYAEKIADGFYGFLIWASKKGVDEQERTAAKVNFYIIVNDEKKDGKLKEIIKQIEKTMQI